MQDILEKIVAAKRVEVERQKAELSLRFLRERAEELRSADSPENRRSMTQALVSSDTGIIAEFKRKSPSRGWIKPNGDVNVIPASYERNGAAAVSVLTDEAFFGGHPNFLAQARHQVGIPLLRKDFIIDEYQLFQAKVTGADAVLLIAAVLPPKRYESLLAQAHQLGLEVLLEIHTEQELSYTESVADMVGVNNRNLGCFITDISNSFRLAEQLPKDKVWVAESGLVSPYTVRALRKTGFKGFLIGETFMKAPDPGHALKRFIDELHTQPYDD